MKRGKKQRETDEAPAPEGTREPGVTETAADASDVDASAVDATYDAAWDGPTRAGGDDEIADLAAASARRDAHEDLGEDLGVVRGAPTEDVTAPMPASDEVSFAGEGEDAAGEGGDELAAAGAEASVAAEGEGSEDEVVVGEVTRGDVVAGEVVADGSVADPAFAGDAVAREAVAVEADEAPAVDSVRRLESIVESLLFAADRALSVADLKRLVNERDNKTITAALEALRARHAETGIHLASVAGGWQFRTSTENAPWVSKLVAGRPQRLSRAMLETLAIVAYRQPVTRPEIDEIRGVDCGPVLKTLLERNLVRVLGKKEEVGRPMLYGTTPEFLKTFSLRDLAELPTLREFHELSEQQKAAVDAKAPLPEGATAPGATESVSTAGRSPFAPTPLDLPPVDQAEEDELLEALETATVAASRASGPPVSATAEAAAAPEARDAGHDA